MMKKQKLILDCDPGHDDAFALLLAVYSEKLDLLGVSSCSGNQTIEKTSRNASNLLNFFNRNDIPIAKGSPTPMVREARICAEIHGESGLDGFTFPKYKEKYDELCGCDFIIDKVLKNKNIIVITTGPMTNLGLAIKKEPKILNNIKEIIFMGGSTGEGNITKAAEFNILVDPEAADICLSSGVPIRMLGLNVTRKILVTPQVISEAEKIKTKGSDLFVKLMKVFNKNQKDYFGLEAAPLHDPATLVALLNPDVFQWEDMNVKVDTSFTEEAGRTICSKKEPHNVKVAVGVNVDEYWNEIYKHLRKCV